LLRAHAWGIGDTHKKVEEEQGREEEEERGEEEKRRGSRVVKRSLSFEVDILP